MAGRRNLIDGPTFVRGAWRLVLFAAGMYAFVRQVEHPPADPYLLTASLYLMTLPIAGIADAMLRLWGRGRNDE